MTSTTLPVDTGLRSRQWTPARVFLAVSAVVHLPLAVIGLYYARAYPIGAGAAARAETEHIFGVLETNGWHTLGALLVGLVSLVYALRPTGARTAALALGVGHIVLFGLLVVAEPSTFWIASNAADQVIHASTAVFGTACALASRPTDGRAGVPGRGTR